MEEGEERDFEPPEFEEPQLPTEPPDGAPAPEFEEIDETLVAKVARSPDQALLAAHQEAEARMLLDVSEQALTAESGTSAYSFENIVGVGISEKVTGGSVTGQLAVAVYVVAKASPSDVDQAALVPEQVGGVPTDVLASGEFYALPYRGRYRPAPNGVSVGHYRVSAGTLGCLARRGSGLYILSNNHVLANSNAATAGDPVLQPGPLDGGRLPDDVVARMSEFIPLRFGGPLNQVDAAIAQASPRLMARDNRCLGRIAATPVPARRGTVVRKCGRTTQFTRGLITDTNATVRVNYSEAGVATFQNQILVQGLDGRPFSQPGDSGSLIVEETLSRPTALLFGGGPRFTIGSRIGDVLAALNISIVT